MEVAWQVSVAESMIGAAVAHPAVDELELLVREHARLVFRVAYSVLRNHHDAEDAAQETFMRLLRHRPKLAEIADPRAWLARVAWRVAIDRRPKATAVDPEEAAAALRQLRDSGATADELIERAELMALLEALVPTLPRDLRDVLTLSTVEELNSAQIAAVLGMPEGSVRQRLFRARQLLRDKFAAVLEGSHGSRD